PIAQTVGNNAIEKPTAISAAATCYVRSRAILASVWDSAIVGVVGPRLLRRVLVRLVMAHDAAGAGAEYPVVSRHVARKAANRGTFQTTLCLRRICNARGCAQAQNRCYCNEFHFFPFRVVNSIGATTRLAADGSLPRNVAGEIRTISVR